MSEVDKLEKSLQEMASSASVQFDLWNRHSNAALNVIAENDILKSKIETQSTLITELVEALEWYEDKAYKCKKITDEGARARSSLDKDGGERAKSVLTKAKDHTKEKERANG